MWYDVSRMVVRGAFRVLWPTSVHGLANVPEREPVILASNHLAFIDSIVIPMIVPRRVAFIAKAEYFTGTGIRGRFDRMFFTMVGAVPVDRSAATSATASLEQGAQVLHDGHAFGIYPEGTRSRTGMLHRGKTGAAWLSMREKVPVVPVGIVGTNRAQSIADNSLRPFKRLQVSFGEPILPDEYLDRKPAIARRDMTDDIMAAIAELSGQERSSEYAQRPAR